MSAPLLFRHQQHLFSLSQRNPRQFSQSLPPGKFIKYDIKSIYLTGKNVKEQKGKKRGTKPQICGSGHFAHLLL